MYPSIDQERRESEAWMRSFVNNMLRGLRVVKLQSVRYRSSYENSTAYIIFLGSVDLARIVFKVEIASEDNDVFLYQFPAQNTEEGENDGFVGSVEEFRKVIRSSEFRHSYIKALWYGSWPIFRVERTKVLPKNPPPR